MATTVYGNATSNSIKNSPKTIKKKVKGLSFPFGTRMEGGFFPLEADLSLVKNNIRQLLTTERGERVMLPKFGTNLRRFLFSPMDEVTFDAIKEEILTSISRYTRGVRVLKLSVNQDDRQTEISTINIKLSLKIKEIENSIVEVKVKI